MTRHGTMGAMKVELPELFWYDGNTTTLDMPDGWQVELHPMRGGGAPALGLAAIARGVESPIESPRLRELARGGACHRLPRGKGAGG